MMPLIATAEPKINPWKQCGIGGLIFDEDPILAAVSNIIWDLGTTAISSKITTPDVCNESKVDTAKLIGNSLPELEKNLAGESGDYISALVQTTGCEEHSVVFKSNLKSEYTKTLNNSGYASMSSEEKALNMYQAVKTASETAQCSAIL